MHTPTDETFMQRSLELAEIGQGKVSPNPMVGCVIVNKEGKIIGEGYHQQYGGPHAEVQAIKSVQNKDDLHDATLYVSLEPCAHYGKTPPCADLIIQYPFKKVVVCNIDPNPLVAGKGIDKIKNAGIEVVEGVRMKEGRALNKRFFTFMEQKRPFIILKWAQTADGFIARKDYSSKWISNSLSRKLVHKWRSEEDAVIVGTNTVIYDNPQLNVRDWQGRNPVRIFLDKSLKVKADSHILDRTLKTICYNSIKTESNENLDFVKINPTIDLLQFILQDLYERKIQSIIVEGGTNLLQLFIDNHLWDEGRIFISKVNFEDGIKAPILNAPIVEKKKIDNDDLLICQRI